MKRGARVYLKDGSPRNVGTIASLFHRANGETVCCVWWDNGWRTGAIAAAELAIAEPEEHATECDVMRAALERDFSKRRKRR